MIEARFVMNENKNFYERKAYTFMDFLGDFGGYNGSLLMICGFFISFYSTRMYSSSVSNQVPYTNKTF